MADTAEESMMRAPWLGSFAGGAKTTYHEHFLAQASDFTNIAVDGTCYGGSYDCLWEGSCGREKVQGL